MAGNTRVLQRAATESAIVDAAWKRYASVGPDGTSVREVAGDAGCNHALVARYFGSKDGLVESVAQRLERCVETAVEAAMASDGDPVHALLTSARRNRSGVQLLVRGGLGDLGDTGCPVSRHARRVLATDEPSERSPEPERVRHRLCVYGAASLVLGWLTYEDFVVAATGLGSVSKRRRDVAITALARLVMDVANADRPTLTRTIQVDPTLVGPEDAEAGSAQEALVDAAVELFAEHGPASVSVRDVARHAGRNQGLIYRHLGSKQALIAAAFEQGSSVLFPAALSPEGFDIDTVIYQVHHGAPAPRLIARILVDDVDIGDVREQFPILRQLLGAYGPAPQGGAAPDFADPRFAVASVTCMAMGSAIYGSDLRAALDLPDDGSIEAVIADLCRVVLAVPLGPTGSADGWR